MAEKKYYWLKLEEGFFRQKEIKKLRKLAGGDTYTIIYLKLLLRSLENNGFLYYEGIEPTFAEELALDIDEDEDNVSVTLNYLKSRGILEEKSPDEFLLLTCQEMTGSETASAKRMRKSRALKNQTQALESSERNNVTEECNNVQIGYSDVMERYIEIDIEKDTNTDTDNTVCKADHVKKDSYSDKYSDICDYLNNKAGTGFRPTTKKTQQLIKARIKEGFTVDDFKTVIDKKVADWKGTEWEQYLRPETLFGTKFESYLNAKRPQNKQPTEKPAYNGVYEGDEHILDFIINGG